MKTDELTNKSLHEHRFTVIAQTTVEITQEHLGPEITDAFYRAFPKAAINNYDSDISKELLPKGKYIAEIVQLEQTMNTYEIILAAKQLGRIHCGARGLIMLHAKGFLEQKSYTAYYINDDAYGGIYGFSEIITHFPDHDPEPYFRWTVGEGLDASENVKGMRFVWFKKVQ